MRIINSLIQCLDLLVRSILKIRGAKTFFRICLFEASYQRRLVLFALDALMIFGSIYGALYLRFEQVIPGVQFEFYLRSALLFTLFKAGCFYLCGMYRPLLRYSGPELLEIPIKATLISDGLFVLFNALRPLPTLPRSVQIIGALIALVGVISSRLVFRRLVYQIDAIAFRARQHRHDESRSLLHHSYAQPRVIIYGAGRAGMLLAQSILRGQNYHIVAFVDDEPSLVGRIAQDIKIHDSADVPLLIDDYDVSLILLAVPSATPHERQQILQRLHPLMIEVKTIPTLEEIVLGQVSISQTREVDVADLLGREEVLPDATLLQADITGKVVLVTGAGGSIGSELCRQIAQQKPQVLVLFELTEYALYAIEMELVESYPQLQVIPFLGSVTDAERLRQAILKYRVETIYHAAAYKHVPLVEANPAQGVMNNAYGTLVTAQVANECRVNTFVLISTDKAVRPTNVMGATKRIAELTLQALAAKADTHTRFIMVRFGNVLGSSGSVVPRFRRQIAERKPITITHPDITRYFMSIPEAARLVIQAGAMGQGGEVFLLNMGEPVRIYDLAIQMIELSGLQPGQDIEIQITGLRPGEKLYEELLINDDNAVETRHPKIYAAHESMIPWTDLETILQQLFVVAQSQNTPELKRMLKRLVPEYKQPNHAPRQQPLISPPALAV